MCLGLERACVPDAFQCTQFAHFQGGQKKRVWAFWVFLELLGFGVLGVFYYALNQVYLTTFGTLKGCASEGILHFQI